MALIRLATRAAAARLSGNEVNLEMTGVSLSNWPICLITSRIRARGAATRIELKRGYGSSTTLESCSTTWPCGPERIDCVWRVVPEGPTMTRR